MKNTWITIPISILIGCIIIAAVIGYQIKQMSTDITGAIADAQIAFPLRRIPAPLNRRSII